MMVLWVAAAWANGPVVLSVPEGAGPWMKGTEALCTEVKSRGRTLGDTERPLDGGLSFSCRRADKKVDEICLTVSDVAAWPASWPSDLSCTVGKAAYDVSVVVAFDPNRAKGETLWVRRTEGATIAYTWTFPEGPLNEDGRGVRSDGRPWPGITCEARGAWLSLTVRPEAAVDEGRCVFRDDVSIPLRVENVRL
jgi:hypothetical protein